MYYRNANCAVVVYDITQASSLEKARTWIRELQRQADPSIVIALCGNKLDLAARRQVSQEEAKKYADEEGLMWTETSAKTGEGVTEIFTEIGTHPLTRHSLSRKDNLSHLIATKLPLTAPSTARSGARPGSTVRTGVDLNKQSVSGQPDSCNC
jgi:Ras-related protein Rab-5C